MKALYVIPARGGSKGIPYKNIKPLDGKPLICYSIDVARALASDDDICISTDDGKIIEVVEKYGIKVPFIRPDYLAADDSTTNDVLLHAIQFYEQKGIHYDTIVLLQPTSPLRTKEQVSGALSAYDDSLDMIVSVKQSHAVSVLCQENSEGYVELYFNKDLKRRQDSAHFYEYNGAIYVINVQQLKLHSLSGLNKIRKYVMDEISSVDIDTELDFRIADLYLKSKNSF